MLGSAGVVWLLDIGRGVEMTLGMSPDDIGVAVRLGATGGGATFALAPADVGFGVRSRQTGKVVVSSVETAESGVECPVDSPPCRNC